MTRRSGNPFIGLNAGDKLDLEPGDRFGRAGHLWAQAVIDALILAWAARRPLLVRGEAGSGKSQIARAAAAVLRCGTPFVEVIHPRFDALDLLYQEDTVRRLADANVKQLDPTNESYVRKGALWQAIEATGADGPTPVLLIDEIDKADADVPNALLDVLGNRSFTVPPLGGRTVTAGSDRLPLIVITTNEERELPAAFVRRCAVLNLNPPDGKDAFMQWLDSRGRVHAHLHVEDAARALAAGQVYADRENSLRAGYPPVGLAEYIDLLTALHELTRDEPKAGRAAAQMDRLRRIGAYALVKNADQDQRRPPVGAQATDEPAGGPDSDAPADPETGDGLR